MILRTGLEGRGCGTTPAPLQKKNAQRRVDLHSTHQIGRRTWGRLKEPSVNCRKFGASDEGSSEPSPAGGASWTKKGGGRAKGLVWELRGACPSTDHFAGAVGGTLGTLSAYGHARPGSAPLGNLVAVKQAVGAVTVGCKCH